MIHHGEYGRRPGTTAEIDGKASQAADAQVEFLGRLLLARAYLAQPAITLSMLKLTMPLPVLGSPRNKVGWAWPQALIGSSGSMIVLSSQRLPVLPKELLSFGGRLAAEAVDQESCQPRPGSSRRRPAWHRPGRRCSRLRSSCCGRRKSPWSWPPRRAAALRPASGRDIQGIIDEGLRPIRALRRSHARKKRVPRRGRRQFPRQLVLISLSQCQSKAGCHCLGQRAIERPR